MVTIFKLYQSGISYSRLFFFCFFDIHMNTTHYSYTRKRNSYSLDSVSSLACQEIVSLLLERITIHNQEVMRERGRG